jgi:phosphoserine phosphatase
MNTTMNLVLQGPQADPATLACLAQLASPQRTAGLGAHALRCEGVTFSADLKERIDAAAFEAGVDATFIAPGRSLADVRLVAMDMDSTLITIECIDEIADMQGLKPQVSEITEAAMRGELDFSESLRRRVALLAGLDAGALQRVYDERLRISPGGEAMLKAVRAAGIRTLLVSGGFTFFTKRLEARLGLDYTHANVLEKKRTVERVCAELGIAPSQAVVMGDGANDLAMMRIAGLSVAFRAKPVVRAQADVALNYSGLDGLLTILA